MTLKFSSLLANNVQDCADVGIGQPFKLKKARHKLEEWMLEVGIEPHCGFVSLNMETAFRVEFALKKDSHQGLSHETIQNSWKHSRQYAFYYPGGAIAEEEEETASRMNERNNQQHLGRSG